MTPSAPQFNLGDSRFGQAVLIGNGLAGSLVNPDATNDGIVYLGLAVGCSDSLMPTNSVPAAFGVAPFGVSVSSVVSICPKEQVGWLNAVPNIALVTNAYPFRDFSVSKGPRKSVNLARLSGNTVAISVKASSPQQTAIGRSYTAFCKHVGVIRRRKFLSHLASSKEEISAGELCTGTTAVATACPDQERG